MLKQVLYVVITGLWGLGFRTLFFDFENIKIPISGTACPEATCLNPLKYLSTKFLSCVINFSEIVSGTEFKSRKKYLNGLFYTLNCFEGCNWTCIF